VRSQYTKFTYFYVRMFLFKDNIMFTFKSKEEVSCESGCCTPQPKGKVKCPVCHEKAKGVLGKTVAHLVKKESQSKFNGFDGFYYCKTPTCETVYFRESTVLTQNDMSVVVGLKEGAPTATVCYCFDWTKEMIMAELEATGETIALEDIKTKMKIHGCSCEVLNPSGGCCLRDVGEHIKKIHKVLF